MLVDPGEQATPTERAEYIQSVLGEVDTASHERLVGLFADDPDPEPVAVYRTWHGGTPLSDEGAAELSLNASVRGFDPADDDAPSTSKIRVKQTYERALEAGLEDAAKFLRAIQFNPHQGQFASLLRRVYLDEEA